MNGMGIYIKIRKAVFNTATVILTNLRLWTKFDASNNTGGNARLLDSSGNANVGTLYSGAGIAFNGSSGFANVTQNVTANAVAFWVKPSSLTSQSFLQLTGTHSVGTTAGGALTAPGFASPTYYVNGVNTTTLTNSAWNFVVVTTGTAITGNAIQFAKVGAAFFGGSLADVRLFGYVLTSGDVTSLWQTPEAAAPTGGAAPAGRWLLAENNGTLGFAFDTSGAENHALMTAGYTLETAQTGGPQTALMSADNLMFFDGTDDRVQVAHATNLNPVSNYTLYVEAINVQGAAVQRLLCKTSAATSYVLEITTGGLVRFLAGNLATASWTPPVLNSRKLLRLLAVHDATGIYLYELGTSSTVPVASVAGSFTLSGNSSALQIGATTTSAGFYKGVIGRVAIWDVVLSPAQIATLAGSAEPLDVPGNLQGYWENMGNTNADWVDMSGNGRNGTVNGTPGRFRAFEAAVAGRDVFGRTLANLNAQFFCDMGAERAQVADSATISVTAAITVEAWVRVPYTVAAQQVVFGKGILGGTNTGGYALSIESDGKAAFSIGNTTTIQQVKSATVIAAGAWVHIAATWTGTTAAGGLIIYLNAVQDNTATATGTSVTDNANPLCIGSEQAGVSNFEGLIDDIRIYNAVLTPAQIQNNFNASKSGKL